jgi:hypothetical protein
MKKTKKLSKIFSIFLVLSLVMVNASSNPKEKKPPNKPKRSWIMMEASAGWDNYQGSIPLFQTPDYEACGKARIRIPPSDFMTDFEGCFVPFILGDYWVYSGKIGVICENGLIVAINVQLEGITNRGKGRTISLITEFIYLPNSKPFPDPIEAFDVEVLNWIDVYDQIRGRKKHVAGQIAVGIIKYSPAN